jgi:mRNA-degrading endonuclease RelE of RelBE toxin-antitoxin system
MSEQILINVSATVIFLKNIRRLKKKYRNILQDLKPIIKQLEQGNLIGDQIPEVNYPVFKVRVINSDSQKGKSGGYRFIYYLKTSTNIILLTIYSKSEQINIKSYEIRKIIEQYENQSL